MRARLVISCALLVGGLLVPLQAASMSTLPSVPSTHATTVYKTVEIDGLKIFYREAGPPGAPTVLLLHGFPSSSRMFEPLIPLLADRYHVVAPTIPASAVPTRRRRTSSPIRSRASPRWSTSSPRRWGFPPMRST